MRVKIIDYGLVMNEADSTYSLSSNAGEDTTPLAKIIYLFNESDEVSSVKHNTNVRHHKKVGKENEEAN